MRCSNFDWTGPRAAGMVRTAACIAAEAGQPCICRLNETTAGRLVRQTRLTGTASHGGLLCLHLDYLMCLDVLGDTVGVYVLRQRCIGT